MKKLSVLSPVYNEELVIADFHRTLRATLDSLAEKYNAEVIYIVDACPDRSLEILREIAHADPRVKILALSARFGHQMALLAGIDHATGDAIVMLDSDLQHPPQLIPQLLAEYEKGYDVVFTIRQPARDTGIFRRASSRLFYGLINRLSQIPIDESAADFRLISAPVARVFQTQIRERNQFLRGLMNWVGFRRVGLHFTAQERARGRTKYSASRLIRFAITGIVSFSKKPLQAAIIVGFCFALMGLLVALDSLFIYFFKGNLPSGWTTLAILISGFSGVQLIFLGVIGEYVGAIFDEVKARPHYIVQEKINLP
ncbi:MAG: glycosyltransferase family 2 protein [Chthoniobacterales bacterium]